MSVVVVSTTLAEFLLDVLVANLWEEVEVAFLAEEVAALCVEVLLAVALFFDEVLLVVAALFVLVVFFFAA